MSGDLVVRKDIDSWVEMLGPVGELANRIAGTDFAPAGLRNSVAATAAAILAGREIGLPPMASMQHIRIIKGTPALSAQMQRALILAAGHEIAFEETTDTRCVVRGRRAGSQEWSIPVQWTLDDARKQELLGKDNWKRMPRQMLIARATSELARLHFADVIAGMAYTVEELADEPATFNGQAPTAAPPEPAPRRRTAQRKPLPVAASTDATTDGGREARPVSPSSGPPRPPLPGEDDELAGREDPAAASLDPTPPAADQGGGASRETTPGADQPDAGPPHATKDQLSKLHAALGEFDLTNSGDEEELTPAERRERDHARKLGVVGQIAGRRIESTKNLTRVEASTVIDTLERLLTLPDAHESLLALLATLEPAKDEQ